jgi:hypothetical protein
MVSRSDRTARQKDERTEFLFGTNDFAEKLKAYRVELTPSQIPGIRNYGLVTMNDIRNGGTEGRTSPSPAGRHLAI